MTEERESETAINVDGGMAMSYRLPQGRMLRIQRALGWTLHCDGGVVHLTQQGDARDIVLGAGGAAALATNGRVLLDAHGDAHLRLAPPALRRDGLCIGWRAVDVLRPAVVPVVRLLAARRHGATAPELPLSYEAVFRDPRLLENLVARAHRERNEAIAAAFAGVLLVAARGGVVACRSFVRISCAVAQKVKQMAAGPRLQLPSVAETFAARIFLRSRTWH